MTDARSFDRLFEPFALSGMTLANRMVMAPMTRQRATLDGVPTDMMVAYYRQRASAGLIITEGTYPTPDGRGYVFTPGLCTAEQVAGWRRVTDAVHGAGGRIVCQLMHCGRLSDRLMMPGGVDPVAPSAVAPSPDGLYAMKSVRANRPYARPRALDTEEVYALVEGFRAATERAADAGFDAVEIHAGSGYLPMQFLSTNINFREDEFGGGIAGRCRFLLAIAQAMATVRGGGFVGVRLHPGQALGDAYDENPVATYSHLIPRLSDAGIGYIHLSRRPVGWDVPGTLRPLFAGAVMVGGGFARATAADALAAGQADLVAFGQAYIANPDLVDRYRGGLTVNRPELESYYSQGEEGYLDYPVYAARDARQQLSADVDFVSALQAEREGRTAPS